MSENSDKSSVVKGGGKGVTKRKGKSVDKIESEVTNLDEYRCGLLTSIVKGELDIEALEAKIAKKTLNLRHLRIKLRDLKSDVAINKKKERELFKTTINLARKGVESDV